MFNHLIEDIRRCGDTPAARIREVLLNPGFWAVVGYRFRRKVFTARIPRPIRWVLNVPATLAQLLVDVATGIQLPSSAQIGPGLSIPHNGYIVVSSRAVIGSHCTITQGVTIGHASGGGKSLSGCPVLGDRVYVGPGAAVIVPITVGDDALIGVGAVVIRSVPPRGVVAGNPARLLSRAGSFGLIEYPGMDADPDRLDSLASVEKPTNRLQPLERRSQPGSNTMGGMVDQKATRSTL